MQGTRIAAATLVRMLVGMIAMIATLAACTLPRSGPTSTDIIRGTNQTELGIHLVDVTPEVAQITRPVEATTIAPAFTDAGVLSPETIRAGDAVSVRVWENVDNGILAGVGQRASNLEALKVDQSGEIFVPYVGEVKASGKTPDELRKDITQRLSSQTPDPQVEVVRIAGDGATVSVMGGVRNPGIFPIDVSTRRLSAMLAKAGGVSTVPDVAQVRIERGGNIGKIWLQDLYDNPALDIALRPNDQIVVEEDRRSFTALGATSGQARVPFNKRDMSALEAIATAGGLDFRSADPTGVFVFRDEPATVANRVLGTSDLVGPQRMAYLIDLTRPEGVFAAREFVIHDEDTVYITEAPLASWARVIAIATATASLGRTIDLLTSN
ncbi:MAG: polysaccharide biosynthesis/export family protein [Amaricoccus sp.]|uniref:polysaccharide biosynthesis/export family protein n=1 Tax=Amaricoccus sp. TaxID=1872485 RepID=UPI0039E4D891